MKQNPFYSFLEFFMNSSSVSAQVPVLPQQNKAYECIGLGQHGHKTTTSDSFG